MATLSLTKRPEVPTRKIADCDQGLSRRLIVTLGAQGYAKTLYSLVEPRQDKREARTPRQDPDRLQSFKIKPKRKGHKR